MRPLALVCTIAFLASSAAAQMKPKPAAPQGQYDLSLKAPSLSSARRITRDEATALMAKGKVTFVDVRSKKSFDAGHIKGAISIPQSQLASRAQSIPRDRLVVTYCACKAEETASAAVLYLNRLGVTNAAALKGGWNEWTAAGLPTEKSK